MNSEQLKVLLFIELLGDDVKCIKKISYRIPVFDISESIDVRFQSFI